MQIIGCFQNTIRKNEMFQLVEIIDLDLRDYFQEGLHLEWQTVVFYPYKSYITGRLKEIFHFYHNWVFAHSFLILLKLHCNC